MNVLQLDKQRSFDKPEAAMQVWGSTQERNVQSEKVCHIHQME